MLISASKSCQISKILLQCVFCSFSILCLGLSSRSGSKVEWKRNSSHRNNLLISLYFPLNSSRFTVLQRDPIRKNFFFSSPPQVVVLFLSIVDRVIDRANDEDDGNNFGPALPRTPDGELCHSLYYYSYTVFLVGGVNIKL